jgi:exopolyphosphatase/pppGpp-phosphohydrolase
MPKPSKTKLIIDIGSNSIKSLTVRGKEILHKRKTDTGLYSMVVSHSSSKHIISRLMQLIEDIAKENQQYLPDEIIIYATETVRQFEGKEDLIQAIKNKLQINLRILSGQEEAEFSYKVASKKFPKYKDIVVIDLGGASTEVSLGLGGKYATGVSLPIGAHNMGNIGLSKINSQNDLRPIEDRIMIEEANPKIILMGGMVDCLSRLGAIETQEDDETINLSQFKWKFLDNKDNLTDFRQTAASNGFAILNYVLSDLIPKKILICREDLRFYFT